MPLRSEEIVRRLKDRNVDPLAVVPCPDLTELVDEGAAALDLRLGTWFMSFRKSRVPYLDVLKDPGLPEITQLGRHVARQPPASYHYCRFGEFFVLHPRAFVLATTLEWIRLPRDLCAYVIGRSSWGRRGLIIATATGVHPGFAGCLTLELTNVGELPICLHPGLSICQLFFETAVGDSRTTDQSQHVGKRRPAVGDIKYDDFAEMLRGWGK
jgi:dCTP deaminase